MSFFKHKMMLNELQVNGQQVDDNPDNFDVADDAEAETPAETADNAADDAGDTGDDEDDDFTLDDEDDSTDDEDTTEDEDANDDTDDGGNDEDDDFTMDDEDGDTEGEDNDGDAGSGEENNSDEKTPSDPSDGIADQESREIEKSLYDTLTDDQKKIRVLQLKLDYKDLYESIMKTMEGVNAIPKTIENLETIKRLQLFLVKSKKILIDYLDNNFDRSSYIENYTIYIKYQAILRTISKVIENINGEE